MLESEVRTAGPSSNVMASADQPSESRPNALRRGLLAVFGGIGAAAFLKSTTARATSDTTVSGASTANYGLLASPGTGGSPILPNIGQTTHAIIGSNSGATEVPFSSGVAGVRNGAGLVGVLGANGSAGQGVMGISATGVGAEGDGGLAGIRGTSETGRGVIAISTSNNGLFARNNADNVPTILVQNNAATTKLAAVFKGNVRVTGNFSVTGSKAAVVEMPDGTLATMYCQESPEPYFEDFGRAELVNGVADVKLDGEFASLVRKDDYMVFVMPEGETNGLFVSERHSNSFTVRESNGGRSTTTFTYRVVARRKDIGGERLARQQRYDIADEIALNFDRSPPAARATGPDDARAT